MPAGARAGKARSNSAPRRRRRPTDFSPRHYSTRSPVPPICIADSSDSFDPAGAANSNKCTHPVEYADSANYADAAPTALGG